MEKNTDQILVGNGFIASQTNFSMNVMPDTMKTVVLGPRELRKIRVGCNLTRRDVTSQPDFNSLHIPTHLALADIVIWGQELRCAQDHYLITNYFGFIDYEAEVSPSKLSPNILYYLPTFFHFLVKKSRGQ